MSDWERHWDHDVVDRFHSDGGGLIEIAEHRGHQNWEATARLFEEWVPDPSQVPDDVFHGASKRETLEHAREEWGLDVDESDWNLDPSWSNVHESIGPGGVVGR